MWLLKYMIEQLSRQDLCGGDTLMMWKAKLRSSSLKDEGNDKQKI